MRGLCRLCGTGSEKEALRRYRSYLYWRGSAETKPGKGTISEDRAEAVLGRGGRLSLAEALRRRVPWFEDSGVLGGRNFVEALGEHFRGTLGRKREVRAKEVPQEYGDGLAAMRAPRKKGSMTEFTCKVRDLDSPLDSELPK